MKSVRVFVLSDASFASILGLRSQLRYVILLDDDDGSVDIMKYGSNTCQHVTRSVMAAEVQALIPASNVGMLIREAWNETLGHSIEKEAFFNSRMVLDVVAKNNITAEFRLQIDIIVLKENHCMEDLKRIG